MDWQALLSTFGVLFLAELGDKTQLAVIAQTCRYRRPWAIFLGATLALAVATALGVVAGQLVGHLIPAIWMRRLAAVGFLVMGAFLVREAWRAGRKPSAEACASDEDPPAANYSSWQAFGTTFGLLALAEMGDKTQLAVFAQASQAKAPWAVFGGAILALAGVTALAVVGGQGLVRIVPERWLHWLAALAFVGMGIWIGVRAI